MEEKIVTIPAFVAQQLELLELELQAENESTNTRTTTTTTNSSSNSSSKDRGPGLKGEQEEERPIHILGSLEVTETSVGLYGRTVVQLSVISSSASAAPTKDDDGDNNDARQARRDKSSSSKSNGSFLLPSHKFTVGDEVEIRGKGSREANNNKTSIGGVINAVSDTYISVTLFQSNNRSTTVAAGSSSCGGNKTNNQSNKSKKRQQISSIEDDDEQTYGVLQQSPLTLVPRSSIDVHRKMVGALQTLEKYGVDHPVAGDVIKAMFFPTPEMISSSTASTPNNKRPQPFNPALDHTQLDAIDFALDRNRKLALIHGPPGTGKTTTIAELIQQAVHYHGMRVLVTAPSNVAVDNILERLAENYEASASSSRKSNMTSSKSSYKPLKMVRLGHPARIKSSVVSRFSLEALVQSADGTEIVHDVRNELQSFLKLLANPKSRSQDKRIAYRELKTLRKEIRTREERVVQDLVSSANVVLATTVGASNRVLDSPRGGNDTASSDFDLVIIDEAAQALEASCWIPILRAKKVVLAGDHLQLPPTIKSKDRRALSGLGETMFERLQKLYKTTNGANDTHPITRMLKIQYRMHHLISDWASETMYGGELMTHESVRNRTLAGLPSVQTQITDGQTNDYSLASTTLLLVDSAGCDMHEGVTAAGSRFNEGEASIVNQHVRELLNLGLQQEDIAVISPYNGQCELLRSLLLPDFPRLEIRSVDGFQGGEKEAVVFSLVRSSNRALSGIGFLRDDRRTNVAVTRARRHLCCICDTDTVSKSSFIQTLVDWMEKHGDQRSAIEYVSESTKSRDKYYEQDLKAAEALLKMVEAAIPSSPSPKSKSEKDGSQKNAHTTKNDQALEESKRRALMDRISSFAENAKNGEELVLSSELTSYDRRLVHEFAEQIGILHRSVGEHGKNRRIILTVHRCSEKIAQETIAPTLDSELKGREEEGTDPTPASNFAALALDESDDESNQSSQQEKSKKVTEIPSPNNKEQDSFSCSSGNTLLAQLAKERATRRQQASTEKASGSSTHSVISVQKKKSKGRLLGGSTKTSTAPADEGLDDLDDMAFLDAQVEKNTNAHGRTVTGKGKQYRTVINGILNARPEPKPKQTNAQASKSLQAKLREAESARKVKPKKKKK